MGITNHSMCPENGVIRLITVHYSLGFCKDPSNPDISIKELQKQYNL